MMAGTNLNNPYKRVVSINPFDIIRISNEIPAVAIISSNTLCTESIEINLPIGSILLSNTHNYRETDKFSFVPQNSHQLDSIKNIYLNKPMHKVRLLSYEVRTIDLAGNYQTLDRFEYKSIDPWSPLAHIWVFAYLFLDDKIHEISTARFISFTPEIATLEKIKSEYSKQILTHREALEKIVRHVKALLKSHSN